MKSMKNTMVVAAVLAAVASVSARQALRVDPALPSYQRASGVSGNLTSVGRTAFFWLGKLVEFSPTEDLFTNPKTKHTEDYVTGRFG